MLARFLGAPEAPQAASDELVSESDFTHPRVLGGSLERLLEVDHGSPGVAVHSPQLPFDEADAVGEVDQRVICQLAQCREALVDTRPESGPLRGLQLIPGSTGRESRKLMADRNEPTRRRRAEMLWCGPRGAVRQRGTTMSECTITYYGYNGFIVESGAHRLAIDPGTSLYLPRLGPVIPKSEWPSVTHIFVTHADPDHYWNADRMARVSGAPVICGDELVERRGDGTYLVYPRKDTLEYSAAVQRAYPMTPLDEIDVDGVHVGAIPAHHGDLRLSFLWGLVDKTVRREPQTLFAKGEVGFVITVGATRLVNLGDTLLIREWGALRPDVLMIPIGGREVGNTMDEREALEAVDIIEPKRVIPCHYDCGLLLRKRGNPADASAFKRAVEERGIACDILQPGEQVTLP